MTTDPRPPASADPALLVLPPELTHAQAVACLELLQQTAAQQTDRAQPLRVDAGLLQRFDSSALAVLLALRRASQRQGRGFEVLHLPQRLRTLAGLYGVDALLGTARIEAGPVTAPEPAPSP